MGERTRSRFIYTNHFLGFLSVTSLAVGGCTDVGDVSQRSEGVTAEVALAAAPVVSSWVQHSKLVAADTGPGDAFASALALSGQTALIGARWDNDLGSTSGSAYVFDWSGAQWVQDQKLLASDGAQLAGFGGAVTIDGDTMLIGRGGSRAYYFERSGASWTERQKLFPSDSFAQGFGRAITVLGDTALIGAPWRLSNQGAVYVYSRTGTTWSQDAMLRASDLTTRRSFGQSLALTSKYAVMGGAGTESIDGAVYVFAKESGTWTEQTKLVPADAPNVGGYFGGAVDAEGDTILVGAQNGGAAYVFVRTGDTWVEQAKLTASDGAESTAFGCSVAVSGDVALVGAYNDTEAGQSAGAAYVFERTGGNWTQTKKLLGSDTGTPDHFGYSVALEAQTALIGGLNAGAAYVFRYGPDNGSACSVAEDCASGDCVDGICCDTSCDGACESCSAAVKGNGTDGTCGSVPAGTDPLDRCDTGDSAACGLTGVCNASGSCEFYSECAAAACVTATSENPADSCTAAGTCQVTEARACNPGYRCVLGACKTSCAENDDCDSASGFGCVSGKCVLATGSSCESPDTCETGHCVDGVCCETACDGVCEACAAAVTGQTDGKCEPTPVDTDPSNECAADAEFPGSCLGEGVCDGNRQCAAYAKPGTVCAPAACVGAIATTHLCDGQGECVVAELTCSPYGCSNGLCSSTCQTETDCLPDHYCTVAGACEPKKDDGSYCALDAECVSAQCSDGACCSGSCSGGGSGGSLGAAGADNAGGASGGGESDGGESSGGQPTGPSAGGQANEPPDEAGAAGQEGIDTGVGGAAASGPSGDVQGGGCGCRLASTREDSSAALALLVLSSLITQRRRRRRKGSRPARGRRPPV